jgi:glycosyltransferase involved in cell wall biosynthesis
VIHLASGREWRGGERQVFLLVRALAARSVDQLVITSNQGELARRLSSEALPVKPVAWRRGFSPSALSAASTEARRVPSLFHAHDPHALVLAGLASLLAGRTPLVATRRVVFPLSRPGFWARADRVVAISQAVRSVLITGGVEPDRIVVIPSGIDLSETRRVEPGPVRHQLGLPPEAPLAVCVAALTPDKDHATLLRAAAAVRKRHPQLHWVLVGSGPLRESLEREARDLGVDSVVHFLGQVADPLPVVAAADLFVLSSAAEGLGTSVLDAMALAKPVVATAVGGMPEVLGRDVGLLAPAHDPAALAAQVSCLLDDPARARQLGQRASVEVGRWSVDGMVDGVLAVYRSFTLDR